MAPPARRSENRGVSFLTLGPVPEASDSGTRGVAGAARSVPLHAVRREPALCWAVRLATAWSGTYPRGLDWSAILSVAVRERLAPLAWIRSGSAITQSAQAEIAKAWRQTWIESALAWAAVRYAHISLADGLADAGIAPVVLKGAPLAARLYADPTARPTSDIDWFVCMSQREALAELLLGQGWERSSPHAEDEEAFVTDVGARRMKLEVHSHLLPRCRYLPVEAPESSVAMLEGLEVRAHDGPLLPAYLAAHLASHQLPPLLWLVDLWTLWSQLGSQRQEQCLGQAVRVGLHRYLRWALAMTRHLQALSDGDTHALHRLGFSRYGRRDAHPAWRHVVLAPTPVTSVRAAGAWVLPPWSVRDGESRVRVVARRMWRYWRTAVPRGYPRTTGIGAESDTRAGQRGMTHPVADGAQGRSHAICRAVLSAGGEMWVTGAGHSMVPTIVDGERVLLSPPPARIRRGMIVVVERGRTLAMHRVVHASLSTIQTKGDNRQRADPVLGRSAVLARAIAKESRGAIISLSPTLRFGVVPLLRYVAAAAVGVARRAWGRVLRIPRAGTSRIPI